MLWKSFDKVTINSNTEAPSQKWGQIQIISQFNGDNLTFYIN